MANKPSSSGKALRLSLIAQAAEHSPQRNEDSAMQAVAERAPKLAAKAIREGSRDRHGRRDNGDRGEVGRTTPAR
jgi:hypothetical protein